MQTLSLQRNLKSIAKYVLALALPFFCANVAQAGFDAMPAVEELDPNAKVVIQDVICGEFDPFVLGDVCLARVALEDGSEVGLIAPFDFLTSYGHAGLAALTGQTASLVGANLEPVVDEDKLDILWDVMGHSALPEAYRFYMWDGVWQLH